MEETVLRGKGRQSGKREERHVGIITGIHYKFMIRLWIKYAV